MKTVANPREMAARQRKEAQSYYVLATAALVLPAVIWIACDLIFPIWIFFFSLIAARLCCCEARQRIQAATRFEQGQAGEDELSEELAKLPSGWRVRRNVIIEHLGDIDFFVISPSGKPFAIDAKSHEGTIITIGQAVYRSYKGAYVPLEKDLVVQVMRQAIAAKELFGMPYVIAVVVFTRAQVLIDPPKIRQAHILSKSNLIAFLLEQETGVVKFPAA
jgi:hypothetical protein